MYVCVEDSQAVLSTAKHQEVFFFFFFFTFICLFLVNESPRLKSHCQSALFLPSLYLYYVCFFFFFSLLLIGSFLPLLDELHMAYAP